MKNFLLIVVMVCCSAIVMAGNKDQSNNKKTLPVVQPTVINAFDTVVLDLSQQILIGNSITFPVSFRSDDTIYALDFSFKYNQNGFIYDTITNNVANLQSVCYYNPNDSTVRYTSFSLQSLANSITIATVHFTTLTGQLCLQDLNTVQGYLNGDLCTVRILPCLGFSSVTDNVKNNTSVNVYPNPAHHELNIESAEKALFELCDLNGKVIIEQTEIQGGEKRTLNIANVANGIYIVKTIKQGATTVQKIAISN